MKMKICESCKAQPATVHLTDINNGHKKETHLCAKCAAAKGLNLSVASALPKFIDALSQQQAAAKRRAADEGPTCPRCGLAWSEFRSKGRFGCPNDYSVFRDRLPELLHDMHGRDPEHVGRAPEGFVPEPEIGDAVPDAASEGDAADAPEPQPSDAPEAPKTLAEATEADRRIAQELERLLQRENLKKRLQEAVKAERYEEAAKLRDELKAMSDGE